MSTESTSHRDEARHLEWGATIVGARKCHQAGTRLLGVGVRLCGADGTRRRERLRGVYCRGEARDASTGGAGVLGDRDKTGGAGMEARSGPDAGGGCKHEAPSGQQMRSMDSYLCVHDSFRLNYELYSVQTSRAID